MKLFRTGDISIVKSCQSYFSFNLPSVLLKKRAEKFDIKYKNHANLLCQMIGLFLVDFVNLIVYMCRLKLLSFFSISFVVFLLVLFACATILCGE